MTKAVDVLKRNLLEAVDISAKAGSSYVFQQAFNLMVELMVETIVTGNKILICGNGGSYCDAMHFAEELTGKFKKDRKPMAAIVLGNAAHLTCVANDYSFDQVFSREVEALGQHGDLLIAISTSGNSKNVINAAIAAEENGMSVISLTGKTGGKLPQFSTAVVRVPSEITERIQEIHIKVLHSAIEAVERELCPELYV